MSSVHEKFNTVNIEVLKELSYEIHVAANFEYGTMNSIQHNLEYKKYIESQGIHVHQISFYRGSLLKNLGAIKLCRELFIKEKYDLIHAHTETGGIITRLALPKNSKASYIFTPHGMSFYKGSSLISWILYYPIEKWICNKMDAVLAINKEEYAVLQRWNKNAVKHIHGIGIGLDNIRNVTISKESKRREFEIPRDAKIIVSIGELNKNKNHAVVIRALSHINDPSIYYIICGNGQLINYLKELSDRFKISKNVIFAGHRNDVIEILKMADLFVFPSYHEGLPVSLMEAMTVGLPIVCSNIRGNTDLVEEGRNGILCNPRNVSEFANAIREGLMSDIMSREIIRDENAKIMEKYSMKMVRMELIEIYKEKI